MPDAKKNVPQTPISKGSKKVAQASKASTKKAWSSRKVLASPYAPSMPSAIPDALPKILKILLTLFPSPFIQRTPRPSRKSSSTLSPQKSSGKPAHLRIGLNETTKLLELHKADMVVLARDATPAILVSHIPALCFLAGAKLVLIPGDGGDVGKLFGVRRVLAFAIEKGDGRGVVEEIVKGLESLVVEVKMDWLEMARGNDAVKWPGVVWRNHRKKADIG